MGYSRPATTRGIKVLLNPPLLHDLMNVQKQQKIDDGNHVQTHFTTPAPAITPTKRMNWPMKMEMWLATVPALA